MIIKCIEKYLVDNEITGKQNQIDFKVRDDGSGPYIEEWNIGEIEEPNLADIESSYGLSIAKLEKIAIIKTSANEIILVKYPSEKQRNASLAINGYDASFKSTMVTYIEGIITQCDIFEAEVNALESVEEILNYSYNFS